MEEGEKWESLCTYCRCMMSIFEYEKLPLPYHVSKHLESGSPCEVAKIDLRPASYEQRLHFD